MVRHNSCCTLWFNKYDQAVGVRSESFTVWVVWLLIDTIWRHINHRLVCLIFLSMHKDVYLSVFNLTLFSLYITEIIFFQSEHSDEWLSSRCKRCSIINTIHSLSGSRPFSVYCLSSETGSLYDKGKNPVWTFLVWLLLDELNPT